MSKDKPLILAIESSTSACSVAVRIGGEIVESYIEGNNVHSQVLLSMVDELLNENSLKRDAFDAIAVGQGPGSFTGLRIGIGVAQGIAFAIDCQMVGISSLDAVAQQCVTGLATNDEENILVAIDARMSEVYWSTYHYNAEKLTRLSDHKVGKPESVIVSNGVENCLGVGNAWQVYEASFCEELKSKVTVIAAVSLPRASSILQLAEQQYNAGNTISAVDFAPIYVRNDVAKKSTKKMIDIGK